MGTTSTLTGAGYVVDPLGGTFQGAATTRAAVRAAVGNTCAVGSLYLSTAGKMYLKVANAAADTDWQRVTTTAAD